MSQVAGAWNGPRRGRILRGLRDHIHDLRFDLAEQGAQKGFELHCHRHVRASALAAACRLRACMKAGRDWDVSLRSSGDRCKGSGDRIPRVRGCHPL